MTVPAEEAPFNLPHTIAIDSRGRLRTLYAQ